MTLIVNKTETLEKKKKSASCVSTTVDLQNGVTWPAWSVQIQDTVFTVFVHQLELLCSDLELL